jgi:hypothetical protein
VADAAVAVSIYAMMRLKRDGQDWRIYPRNLGHHFPSEPKKDRKNVKLRGTVTQLFVASSLRIFVT